MPKRFNGIEIQTPADAASAVISWYRKTVEQLAASNGWEVKCVLKCGESGMVFELDVKQELPFEYGAKPTKLMIRLLHDEFVEAPKDPILSSLLGFEPTFTTGVGNTFEFIVYAGGHNFKKVAPAINVVENGRIKVINMSKAHTLRIGRDVLRALHSTPYSFAGYNNSRSRFIVYNGTIYMMEAPKAGVFVSERVNERNLLMNNVRSDFN